MLSSLLHNFELISLKSENPPLFLWGISVIYLTIGTLVVSVLYKFAEHKNKASPVNKEIKTPLDTFLMALIIASYFPLWLRSLGQISLSPLLQYIYWGTGCFLCVFGVIWHVWSKINIGIFWSDQIEIKKGHKLINFGAYALARHPMYGSMLLWSIGANMLMFSWSGMLIALLIFFPVLYWRGKQEEKALSAEIAEYALYRKNTPMLFPCLSGKIAMLIRIAVLVLFISCLYYGLNWGNIVLLEIIHMILGYSLQPPKVAFSYRSKAGMLLIIFLLGLVWEPFSYLQYLIALMFVYGLRWNCPCMLVYEKYHRCPCFSLLGRCFIKK